ncbi:MAG: hypothetical protein LBT15_07375, partial [Synergistaceae bacterium]|nr:hypothetical protein [Synergistaceae bacterium]
MNRPSRSLVVIISVLFAASLFSLSFSAEAEAAKRVVRGRAGRGGAAAAKTPPTFAGGAGTQKSPYVIRTVGQLVAFAQSVNNGNSYAGKYVKLGGDIELTSPGWLSIGFSNKNGTQPFKGFFDGGGYVIWNLRAVSGQRSTVGLFGALEGATVSNISLQNVEIVGETNVGAVAAFMKNSVLKDCSVSGSVSGVSSVGGIVGSVLGGGLDNCFFSGNVRGGDASVGGLVGTMDQAVVRSGTVKGKVEGNGDVGGIVGGVLSGGLANCRTEGLTVRGEQNTGGLVGNILDGGDVAKSA